MPYAVTRSIVVRFQYSRCRRVCPQWRSANDHVESSGDDSRTTISVHRLRQQDGGCILVFTNVTEVRRLERIRRDFIANVSHELRTPVSVMSAVPRRWRTVR